jgi:23S rRNA-/tRNA-specific pseudouridylate synthase
VARIQGHPEWDDLNCTAPISAQSEDNGLRVVDWNGLAAETGFSVLRRLEDGTALVEARPLTGRTNQIRIHLWHSGFPVVGDPFYLTGQRTGTNQTLGVDDPVLCLSARSIRFRHPATHEDFEVSAPLPDWAT